MRFEHLLVNAWLELIIDHKSFLPADHLLASHFIIALYPAVNGIMPFLMRFSLAVLAGSVSGCRTHEAPAFVTVSPGTERSHFALSSVCSWIGLFLNGQGKDKLNRKRISRS